MASTSTPGRQSEIEISYAFDEIAPPSTSASATSSSTLKKLPCRVFINHRGPDVKQTLARDIYLALYVTGLGVFLDSEELKLADIIPAALQKAMTSASAHVAIFSPGYAQSPWCLAELSFIIKTGAPIIPVFYHVQPTDLRWVEKGVYASAFSEYQEKCRYSPEKLQEWKMALQKVSYYKGEIINSNEEEPEKLKNIVNQVLKGMKVVPLSVAKHPVGLEDDVANFEKIAQESGNLGHPKVQIVGIWGMGGVGKTTLAKELYNKKYLNVELSSFVFDIREAAAKNELYEKQKFLLKDLGVSEIPNFDHIDKGKEILSKHLGSVHVLVVLDDVDHPDQVDALLPTKDSLGWGSLIIVTTREREVLKHCNISSIYEMKGMNSLNAKQLFCWHAFLQPFPRLGFGELVDKFLSACNGLPLSLKVLGGQLYCYSSKDLWEDLLHKISKILPDDIKNRLKVSYDALDEVEKQIFLDVACFFIGEDHMKAIAVWEGSDWNGLCSWERLVNKCLVDLDSNNCIKMHDHLRDLGREIAKTQLPSRLWSMDQIMNIQKEEQETLQIRGMILNAANKGVHKSPGFLRGMILKAANNGVHKFPGFLQGMISKAENKGVPKFPGFLINTRRPFPLELKVFVVKGNYGDKLPIAKFSTKLAWLSCAGIALRNLPLTMENLRVLELYHCRKLVRLWKDGLKAPQLRVLIINDCYRLQGIPKSIELLKNLKKISLINCWRLKSLPEELCCLQSLEHLQLTCSELVSLPSCFGELRKLRHLDLSRSSYLRMLPESFKQLKLLQHLDLRGCCNLALRPDVLENMTELEYLNIAYSNNEMNCNSNWRKKCSEYRKLPMDIGQLRKLRVMKIASQALPESLGSLNHLEHLILECIEVESLPLSIKQLINLQTLIINSCRIGELDFGRGPFTSSLCNLERIDLLYTEVYKISISEECCPRLTTLIVYNSQNLREVDTLPTTVEKIQMTECPELVALPSFAKLVSLKVFLLGNCKVKEIEGLQDCTSLENLLIGRCPELNVLPSFVKLACLKEFDMKDLYKIEKIESLQHCTSLENLLIKGCSKLNVLPNFAKLASLKAFKLIECNKVEKVEGLQHCSKLKELVVENPCWELPVIESLEQMQRLRRLHLVAKNREAIEACIQKIQKQRWPEEIIICTKAVPGAGSLLKSSDFPNLSLLHSFANKKGRFLEAGGKCSSNENPTMLCLVINCLSPRMNFSIWGRTWSFFTEMEEGKWIWIGVFTQHPAFLGSLYINTSIIVAEKGLLLSGAENNVAEAFYRTLARLGI